MMTPWRQVFGISFLLVVLSGSVSAQSLSNSECPKDLPARAAQRLGYLSSPQYEACKPMPNARDKSIIVLSVLAQGLSDGKTQSGDEVYDLDVLIANSNTGRVQSRLLLEKAYESHAERFYGVEIDTARYQLSPTVRAFGLRAEHVLKSGAGNYYTSALSLFIDQRGQISRVLANLLVSEFSSVKGNYCEEDRTEVTRTVAIAPTRSNGFADLLVTTTRTYIESRLAGDDCEEVVKGSEATRTKIHFDGKTYPVSNELR